MGEMTVYSASFLQYLGFAAQVPNVVFNWLNVFVQIGWVHCSILTKLFVKVILYFSGNLTKRIVWSISIEVVIFILTIVLAMTDSRDWPGAFFWITMLSVVVLNSKQHKN